MRITTGESYQELLRALQTIQERMQQAQSELTTGNRVNQPSDDPAGAADIVRLTGEKSEIDQYTSNATSAKDRLDYADSVLGTVQTMVQRIINLGQLASSNPTSSNPASVSAYTSEINSLHDQIVASANSTYQGRFIFGGSVTNKPPYLLQADQSVTYQGNSDSVVVQVGRVSTLQVQIPGTQIFNGPYAFDSMRQLSAAISAGNNSAIVAQISNLQQFYDSLSAVRGQLGSLSRSAQNAQSDLQSYQLARTADQSRVQSADLAQAASDFTQAQTALQAATAAGAKISQISILDYLR